MCRQAQDPGPPGSLRGRHCPLPGRDDGMGPGFLASAQDSVRGGLGGCGAGVCEGEGNSVVGIGQSRRITMVNWELLEGKSVCYSPLSHKKIQHITDQ